MRLRAREIVCVEVVEVITDYLEGTMKGAQRRRFEAHLSDCEHCTEYLAQMRATIALTGRLREEDLTPAMRADFGALYERWRAEEAGGNGSRSR